VKTKRENFFDQVYQVVRLVPFGKVTTYGAIANYLGAKGSARVVGYAMNAAHAYPDIPAHRVVNRIGLLSGKHHFCSPNEMMDRLSKEGIEIKNDVVQDFENHFWDPQVNLDI
jgi:methylated-DNA-protein-cysteine methyltransferase related protein